MTSVVLVEDGASTYAVVHGTDEINTLQTEHRLAGIVVESNKPQVSNDTPDIPTKLQLNLAELYVGLYHKSILLADPVQADKLDSVKSFQHRLEAAVSPPSDETKVDVTSLQLTQATCDRLRVFRDLWELGYTVTQGSKFGADYLIYEDNPAHAHAVAIIIVVGYEESIPTVKFASNGRIGKMVKKQVMYASVDRMKNEVVYIGLDHALLVAPERYSR